METTKTTINIDGFFYDVIITRKKIKRIIMKVDALLKINISCPTFLSQKKCLEFLDKNLEWLRNTVNVKKEIYKKMNVEECLGRKGVWLRGNFFTFLHTNEIKKFYSIDENNLYLPANQIIDSEVIEKIRNPFYSEIENLFNYYKKIHGNIIPSDTTLVFKKLKSKWGSCNYKKNVIVINKVLVSVPERLLQFVLIHEFIHFLYPNHGKNFKYTLNSFLPNFKILEKELKNYNFLLEKGVF